MIAWREHEFISERLVCLDGFGRDKALSIAPAKNVHANGELVSTHLRLRIHLVRIHVDQFDYPVAVRATGGSHEVHIRLATDPEGFGQHGRGEGDHIGAARCLALIIGQPLSPRLPRRIADLLNGPRAKGHRTRWIRDVFGEGLGTARCLEPQILSRLQVKRSRGVSAAGLAAHRPMIEAAPLIGAGLERRHRRDVRRGRAVLEVLRQERPQDVFAEPARGVAAETQVPEAASLADGLAVIPRPQYQLDHAARHILGLDCLIHSDRTVAVLSIPQTVNQHDRDFERQRGKKLVHGLVAPERIVVWMRDDFVPEADLLHATAAPHLAGGGPRQKQVEVVVMV